MSIIYRFGVITQKDYNNGDTVYDYGYDVAGNIVNYDSVSCMFNMFIRDDFTGADRNRHKPIFQLSEIRIYQK
ncbi:MAG: hypothetical protein WBC91_16235 [Phototrophicaceae bacterium]